jgi:hypothetical protein
MMDRSAIARGNSFFKLMRRDHTTPVATLTAIPTTALAVRLAALNLHINGLTTDLEAITEMTQLERQDVQKHVAPEGLAAANPRSCLAIIGLN